MTTKKILKLLIAASVLAYGTNVIATSVLAYGNNVIATQSAETESALKVDIEAVVETYSELSESLIDAINDGLFEEETWSEEAKYEMLAYYFNEHEKALAEVQ